LRRAQSRLPAAFLAGGRKSVAPRADRCGIRDGFHCSPSDRILARSAARRAECVVLFGAAQAADGIGATRAAQIGIGYLILLSHISLTNCYWESRDLPRLTSAED